MAVRKIKLAALLAALILLCLAAASVLRPQAPKRDLRAEPLRIAVASDLHYLSKDLTDNGPFFRAVVKKGDGKLMLDVEAITEAFVGQMIDEAPDLLILSGDLSFNGAYQSHADLAEKLRRIEASGIPVLVIPGNHDLLNSSAARFEGEGFERVRGTTPEDFAELYASFGPDEALAFDENSGSYAVEPCRGLRIILLDTNSAAANTLPKESLSWLEKQLKEARRSGARVITVSHQNLLTHNGRFTYGYVINNAGEIGSLLTRYGVMANLSGHMHIQHFLRDGFPELLTSALSVSPCRYGLLTYEGDALRYEARSVDVSAWAQKQGLTDEKYLDFAAYARDSFYAHFARQILEDASLQELPAEDLERLARCFAETNLAYFAGGELDRRWLADEITFWEETAGEDFHTSYLRSILTDEAPSSTECVLWEKESG